MSVLVATLPENTSYSIKITDRLRKKKFLNKCRTHPFACLFFVVYLFVTLRVLSCILQLFVQSVFYDLCLGFFLCIYTIDFCIYLYGCFSGEYLEFLYISLVFLILSCLYLWSKCYCGPKHLRSEAISQL